MGSAMLRVPLPSLSGDRGHCGRAAVVALFFFFLCLHLAVSRTAAAPAGQVSAVEAIPFASLAADGSHTLALQPLPSREALAAAISCPYTPRPTLVLFVPPESTLADAAVAAVRGVAEQELLPSGLLAAAYTFTMDPSDAANMAMVDIVAPGQDPRRPFLVLYCAALESGYGVPGLPVTAFPSFLPRFYLDSSLYKQQQAQLRRRGSGHAGRAPSPLTDGPSVRQWVLSETAVRFVDPVTLAMLPAVCNVFSIAELHALLAGEVATWGVGHEGGYAGVKASRQPAVVVAAYVHLTTEGSAEVVAALNAASARFGGAVLVLATERREVAEFLGLSEFHTARVVAASPAGLAALTATTTAAVAEEEVGPGHASSLPDAGDVQRVATPTAVGTLFARVVADHSGNAASPLLPLTPEQRGALAAWRGDLRRFLSVSPLRKLTSDEQLRWAFGSQSVKVFFFLRESDALYFPQHLKVATDVARRVSTQWVRFATKSGEKKMARFAFVVDVYWVDAERNPTIASQLRQSSVPSVVVSVPLLSREDEAARDAEAKRNHGFAPPVLNAEGLHGFHTVNQHDLQVIDPPPEKGGSRGTAPSPPTRKADLEPAFPTDGDELLRFLAGAHVLERVQMAMVPVETVRLSMGGSGSGEAASSPPADNKGYLRLDHRYYAPSLAETASPHYLHDIFTGELQLPPYVADEGAREGKGAKATAEAQARSARAKAEWRAQLEQRQRAREERVRAKAAKDAAMREQVKKEIKEEVLKELSAERGKEGNGPSSGVPRPAPPTPPLSEKATLARRRRKALADATVWKDETARLATDYVVTTEGNRATIVHGLEAPSGRR